MLQRILTGITAIAILLTLVMAEVFFAERQWPDHPLIEKLALHGSLIPILFTGVILVSVAEMNFILKKANLKPQARWAATCCVVLMLSPWLCAAGIIGNGVIDVEALHWQLLWFAAAVISSVAIQLRNPSTTTAITDLASTWMIIIYVGLLPSFAIQLRADANAAHLSQTPWTLFFIIMVISASDIGAFFIGSAIGKHKLCPAVSPAKSVEGMFGGIFGSIIVAALFKVLANSVQVPVLEDTEPTRSQQFAQLFHDISALAGSMNGGQIIIFGAVMSICTQLGDLFESMCKRCAQVKDSSAVIPGMGGVLDVIDGLLFAMPAAWYLLTRAWQLV